MAALRSEAKRVRALEDENGRLKRLLADAMLDNPLLRLPKGRVERTAAKQVVTAVARQEAVAHLQALLNVSQRRACGVVDADRISICYCSRRADDADLREKLRVLAQERRRFGYRRLHILLWRDGVLINRKKTERFISGRRLDGAAAQGP